MIPLAKPWIGEEEIAAVGDVLRSGWVTQGPKVQEFEERFAEYVGAEYACAVSSCTAALHLALLSVGVCPGDVVITVSHSFIATANAVRHCGAEPVFVDIDPASYNIDPDLLEHCLEHNSKEGEEGRYYGDIVRLMTGESPLCNVLKPQGRIAAILAVHQMGMPCNLQRIKIIAEKYSIPLVEDAACAIGSEISSDGGHKWQKIGQPHGEIACFSFHPRKLLTTGDGGMLTTNNRILLKKLRLWRQHGMSISDRVRHSAKQVTLEQYSTTGYNYRMTDIQAAIGICQLNKIPAQVVRRRALADNYYKLLANSTVFTAPAETEGMKTNWQSYPVAVDSAYEQEKIMQYLLENNIASRHGIMNAHVESPYRPAQWCLPHSEKARRSTILLPLYSQMQHSDQEKVVKTLEKAVGT